jgi:apolipoprotein N-acyltransferase
LLHDVPGSSISAQQSGSGVRGVATAIWPWLAALTSGILLCLCYPGFNQGWLVWIALAPLVCAVWFASVPAQATRWHRVIRPLLLGYVSGLVYFAVTFRWLAELAPLFKTPWLHGLPVLLALYMASYPAVWALLIHGLPGRTNPFGASLRNIGIGALAASVWTAGEWTRGWLFSGFGWNGLGVALHQDLAMIQIADLAGVLGITWMIVFVNVMAVVVVRRILNELGPVFLKRVRWEFSFTMALMAIVFAYGVRALFQTPPNAVPIRVAAIQPNIPQEEKFDRESEDAILEQLRKLNSLATLLVPQPDLIVWPEAATPRGMFADEDNFRFVMEEASRGDYDLLLGSLDYELDPANPDLSRQYNAAILLSAKGQQRSIYRKMHLVPYGEYLPMRAILPAMIGELVPGDLDRGTEAKVLSLGKQNTAIGVLICFEDTLGDLTRQFVVRGAEMLVNVTNDGWFGRSVAAEQHLANAVFRAIENRRPLLRATNTGVTCAIDTGGRVSRGGLRNFEQGFTPFEIMVPKHAPVTVYTRFGDWLGWVSSGITLALCGAIVLRRRRDATAR